MTPVEERLEALEQRMERMEILLRELKETLETTHEHHGHRVRPRDRREEVERAIARARAEEYRTFAGGMKLVGGMVLLVLACWLGYQVYQDSRGWRPTPLPGRLVPP
jgi:hypothetical protein